MERDGLRHEKPLVGRLALDQGIAEGDVPLERREAGHPVEAAVRAVVADHGTTSWYLILFSGWSKMAQMLGSRFRGLRS